MSAALRGAGAAVINAISFSRDPATDIPTLAVGDLMLAIVNHGNVGVLTPAPGWSPAIASLTNDFGFATAFLWKQRLAGESSYGPWSVSSGTISDWAVAAYRNTDGVGTWSLLDSDTSQAQGGGSSICAWGSVSYPALSNGVALAAGWASTNSQPLYPTAYTQALLSFLGASRTYSIGHNLATASPTEDPANRTGMPATTRSNACLSSFGWEGGAGAFSPGPSVALLGRV